MLDGPAKSPKPTRTVIPANAGIQSLEMDIDSGYRIWSGTGFAGVTKIETFCDFVKRLRF